MKDDFEKLEHYRKYAKQGYKKGFTLRIYNEVIDDELYETHQYFVPVQAAKRVRFMKKFFQTLHDTNIPIDFRRRKSPVEFGETCVNVLQRIDMMCSIDSAIVAGSRYVSGVPWAIFGVDQSDLFAQNTYKDLPSLARAYKYYLTGNCYPTTFHFRSAPNVPHKLAKKYKTNANYVMALALSVCYDVIHNCGPDCFEFFDLFTNDHRESPENFNIDSWQSLRCKILGVERLGPLTKSYRRNYVEIEPQPKRPFKAKTKIEELEVEGDDLTVGCTSRPTFLPERKISDQSETDKYRDYYVSGDDSECCCPYGYKDEIPTGVHGLHFRYGLSGHGVTPDMM